MFILLTNQVCIPVPIMPVFLHQNVLEQNMKSHKHVSRKHLKPTAKPAFTNFKNYSSQNDATYKDSKTANETGPLRKMKIDQVVKDIFESSVVGGKERHEKVRQALGKDPDISESLIHENARVGALFASKAFVQLIVNPIVGIATQKIGYQIPFLAGTCILLISSISKLCL